MKKIMKLFIFTLMLFFSVATITVSSFAWYVSVIIINYQYEDGSEAAPIYRVQEPEVGVTYHIDSPVISGFKPDLEYIECTYSGGLAGYFVTYYEDGYRLIINYKDEEGNTLADSYNQVLDKDSEYAITSPSIDGYVPNIDNVVGTLDSNKEIDVIYSKNTYSLIINYLDDANNVLANQYSATLTKNSEYAITSPTITGYTPNISKVSGILDKDKEINVIYTKNNCVLKINYLDSNNNTIKNSSSFNYKYGDEYNIEVPSINGYRIDKEYASGTIYENKEIDLVYTANKYTLTINYLDEASNIVANQYNQELDYGTNYNIKSPNVYGYTPNIEYVSGKLENNTVINVTYSKKDYVIIINYVDEEGNPLSDRYYASMKYGSTFSEPSPVIYGYTPDADNISGTLDKDLEYTVTYTRNDYTLTIKYLDQDGNPVAKEHVEVLKYETDYNVVSPIIDGYTVNLEVVSGTLTNNTEIVVLYFVKSFNLTIHYIDYDNNRLLYSESYKLNYNEHYEILTKEIDGYYTNDRSVYGYMCGENLEVNVYYHENRAPFDGVGVVITITMAVTNVVGLLYISFSTFGKHIII